VMEHRPGKRGAITALGPEFVALLAHRLTGVHNRRILNPSLTIGTLPDNPPGVIISQSAVGRAGPASASRRAACRT
jgi:hypothetical protein